MHRFIKNITLAAILLTLLLWACTAGRASEPHATTAEQKQEALFQIAYEHHMKGNLDKAIQFYKRSIEKKPTAKTHTFLGWTLSHQGKYDEAITQCLIAIKLDPDYGNTYNDIGAYYIAKGMYDEAIPYLEKAIEAKNYDFGQFPHFNLGGS